MTDRYERIRAALAMGPTPGPWLICHCGETIYIETITPERMHRAMLAAAQEVSRD